MVEIYRVSKYYGSLRALHDVSLDIRSGEVFGLTGPDGSGKTTLFRIIATLLLPDGTDKGAVVEGSCLVDGFSTKTHTAEIRRRVGYMPGGFSLYQDLSVEENLDFFATLFGTTVEAGYDSIKDIYGHIEQFRKRPAGQLSGGMKQKLALCCALVHNPNVLLLDEPTTGVDPVSRVEFWTMICRLRERGMTVIVSTPYLDEIKHCDRVAFLSDGELRGIGTPGEILTRFKEIFTPVTPRYTLPRRQSPQEDVIIVEDLVKDFGKFRAVNRISFRVRRGEIFGFLGANGAGKTTAMRILCGLSRPTSGHATVAGFDCATEHELIKRNIGYMSQKFSLYDDMTVIDNIRLFGGIYGMKPARIKEKGEALLNRLDLSGQGDSLVGSLPLGRKQRLAFSVSIIHEPEVVFLDEPTGGVDPAARRQFWELIYEEASDGITVFVTTHYMDEAGYCDRISIMAGGEIKALGAPEELLRKFGQPDMNHLFVRLSGN